MEEDKVTNNELAQALEKITNLENELKQAHEKTTYLTSDFENLRKRSFQETQARCDAAKMALLNDILQIIDDFERGFEQIKQRNKDQEPFVAGFELTYKALQKILANHSVKEITALVTFNPEFHEAMGQAPESEFPEKKNGEIVQVLQKGYLYKEHVLRPAKVIIK